MFRLILVIICSIAIAWAGASAVARVTTRIRTYNSVLY